MLNVLRHFINPDSFSLKNLKNVKILKHFFYIFFYVKNLLRIGKNVCDVTEVCLRVCLESVVDHNYQLNPSVKMKNMKKILKKMKNILFCPAKMQFRKNKKVSSNFLEFLLIFVFFCENVDFRKTSWCLLGMNKMPWRELKLSVKNRRN